MNFSQIQTKKHEDGIGIIILNRPEKRNAISIQMRKEISYCLHDWEENPTIDLVIFVGKGSSFSAGFDLTEFDNHDCFSELLESSTKYHLDLWNFPKPTIAAVNGPAVGGGFDLALFCDIRLCSESASFGHPEIKFGAPPLFTPLRWIVGEGHARELCLTGRNINATEAHQMGLVSYVTKYNELLEKAVEIGRTILEAPKDSIRFTKKFFINNAKDFEDSFKIEHDEAFRKVILPKARKKFK